jgi:hypothetical protein
MISTIFPSPCTPAILPIDAFCIARYLDVLLKRTIQAPQSAAQLPLKTSGLAQDCLSPLLRMVLRYCTAYVSNSSSDAAQALSAVYRWRGGPATVSLVLAS